MKNQLCLLLAFLLIIFVANADEIIYPTTINELNAVITLYGQGTISGLSEGEEARLETLTFQESEFQEIKVLKEELTIKGKKFFPNYILDEFGNKHILFHINENGDFNYIIQVQAINHSNILPIEDYNITKPEEMVLQYLKASQSIESSSTEIMLVERNKLFGESFLQILDETINWVNDYVEYASGDDFRKYYLNQKTAIETLISKKGVCDEFANLAAALLRSKNIPTRIATGITFDGKEWGNHAWIEVYNSKLKTWIPSDPTFREAGFVDATHIKMGSFDDVTSSRAKCFYPATANCYLDNQSTMPNVIIQEVGFFDDVTLDSNTQTLKANQWNDFYVTITNKTGKTLTSPLGIKQNYKDIIIQDKKKSAILKPNETKTILFKIMPQIQLEEGQIAKGKITFHSLSEPFEKEVTVEPEKYDGIGDIDITDVTPIFQNGEITLQITSTNYYLEDKSVSIEITGKEKTNNYEELLPQLTTRIIKKEVNDNNEEAYTIKITTPEKIFTQTIVTKIDKLTVTPTRPTQQSTILQNIAPQKEKPSIIETLGKNPIALVVSALLGITVLIIGIVWANKRYV